MTKAKTTDPWMAAEERQHALGLLRAYVEGRDSMSEDFIRLQLRHVSKRDLLELARDVAPNAEGRLNMFDFQQMTMTGD